MRLYGEFQKVTENPDGTITVAGIASSESVDTDGEVILASAIKAALPDYLKFPAVREQHDPQRAAGTAVAVDVGADGKTRIEALIVDPTTVAKIRTRVLRGFSVAGKVVRRSASNPKVIEALTLNEVSVVDRPSNSEATISLWKADAGDDRQVALPLPAPVPEPEQIAKLTAAVSSLTGEREAALAKAADAEARLAKAQAEHGAALAKVEGQRDDALAKLAAAEGRVEKVKQEADALRVELFKRPKGSLRAMPVSKAADILGHEPDDEDEPLGSPEEQARAEIRKVHAGGGRLVVRGR